MTKNALALAGGGYTALIRPDKGGNCLSLRHLASGAELLRTPPKEEELAQNPNLYGTPLLFPPNRIQDGRYAFQGRVYRFPINEPSRNHHIHGTLSVTPFRVERAEENYACLLYRANAESPYLLFPHAFSVALEYRLDERGLFQRLTVTNEGESAMPFGAGFHTALRAPFLPGGRAEDCRLRVTASKIWKYDERILPTGETISAQAYREGVAVAHHTISELVEMDGSGGTALLTDARAGGRIVYEAGKGFRFWMLFNQGGERGFVCPEPQTWLVDAPNSPFPPEVTGFDAIMPGGRRVLETRLRYEIL